MSAVVIVGAQWGDEGKGKVVDLFTEHADVVVRYAGGANAGHTLFVGDGDEKVVMRLFRPVVHAAPSTRSILEGQCCRGQQRAAAQRAHPWAVASPHIRIGR